MRWIISLVMIACANLLYAQEQPWEIQQQTQCGQVVDLAADVMFSRSKGYTKEVALERASKSADIQLQYNQRLIAKITHVVYTNKTSSYDTVSGLYQQCLMSGIASLDSD